MPSCLVVPTRSAKVQTTWHWAGNFDKHAKASCCQLHLVGISEIASHSSPLSGLSCSACMTLSQHTNSNLDQLVCAISVWLILRVYGLLDMNDTPESNRKSGKKESISCAHFMCRQCKATQQDRVVKQPKVYTLALVAHAHPLILDTPHSATHGAYSLITERRWAF
jgi:hypothetical protein